MQEHLGACDTQPALSDTPKPTGTVGYGRKIFLVHIRSLTDRAALSRSAFPLLCTAKEDLQAPTLLPLKFCHTNTPQSNHSLH